MRVGSVRSVGRALTTVVWGYCLIPAVLVAFTALRPEARHAGRTGLLPEPVLVGTALLGALLSWNAVRRALSSRSGPRTVFQIFLVGLALVEFPILLAFLDALTGGRPQVFFGIAAVGTVYLLTVALPAAKSLSAS